MDPGVHSHQRPRACVLLWLVAVTCLCLSPPASGQTPSSLNLLKPLAEDRARVDVFSGANREFVRGRLLDVTDSALVVEGRKGRTEVPAADVLEVWSPGGPRYRRPVIVGSAIGPSLLVSLAACSSRPEAEESECAGRTYGITAGVMGVLTSYSVARQRYGALAYDASRPVPAAPSSLTLQPLLSRRAVGIRGAFTF